MSYGLERFINKPEFLQTTPEEYFRINRAFRDNDGVTTDTRSMVAKEINKMFNTNRSESDIRDWNSVRNWAIEQGLSYQEAQELEIKLWYDPDLLYKADPVPGATEMSYWMYDHGFSFPVISSRTDLLNDHQGLFKNVREATIAWFKKWEPWTPQEDIYMQIPFDIPRGVYKAFIYGLLTRESNGRGLYFEDVPAHAKTVLTYNPNAFVVLLSDLTELDFQPISANNYLRVSGSGGNLPNMHQVFDIFINHKFTTPSVAQ